MSTECRLPNSLPGRGMGRARGADSQVPLLLCLLRYVLSCTRRPCGTGLRPGSTAGPTWGQRASALLTAAPRRAGLMIIPAIRPAHSSSPSAAVPGTASGPYNCPHAGQSGDRGSHHKRDNSEVPKVKFWPELHRKWLSRVLGLASSHWACACVLPRAVFTQ